MKKAWVAAILLLIGATSLIFLKLGSNSALSIPVETSFSTDFAYDSNLFMAGLVPGQSKLNKDLPPLTTLILPHHLIASPLISQGLSQLGNRSNPKTIILLSPNHTDQGGCSIITTSKSWNTPYGLVNPDKNILNNLLSSSSVCIDDTNIKLEHGIAGLLPYLKFYFPETKVVTLAFKRNISLIVLEDLAKKISHMDNVVTIASIDFSHGLPPSESKTKDEEMLSIIKQLDFSKIINLSSQYLDSPSVLVTLLKINQIQNNTQIVLAHSDAKTITQKDNTDNTSYFLIGYYPQSIVENNQWSLIATGDVMLGRSVNTQSLKNNDFAWAFKNIAPLLKSADITLVNLESPLTKDCPSTDQGMIFCGRTENVQGLVLAGVDIASIANNHIGNYGQKGIDETISTLITNRISPVGLGNIAVKNIAGIKVAFSGFDAVSKNIDKVVSETITSLKKQNQLVVASFHWGDEYQKSPAASQIKLAHLAIDSGADVVIGHHPHWVQTEETYKNKPIFYSLGNLIFDQMWSEETKKGMIIKLYFSKDKYLSVDHFPTYIYDYGQPKLATPLQTH